LLGSPVDLPDVVRTGGKLLKFSLRRRIRDGGLRKVLGTEGQSCKPVNTWQKIGIGAGVAAVLAGGTWLAIWQINKGVVTVQTAPAVRQDLTSLVTASGEVKPLTYTNVLGEGIGKITSIAVKEGDHVKKGDVLLRLESVQPAADVSAQRAGIAAADSGVKSADANDVSSQADIKSVSYTHLTLPTICSV